MRQWSWHKGLEFDVFAPTVLATLSLVFILLSVAVVRVMGTDSGYKALFVIFTFLIVLKTILGWWKIACSPVMVPGPIVGAGLPGNLTAVAGFIGWHRSRRAIAAWM
jgi:hypothetical protein